MLTDRSQYVDEEGTTKPNAQLAGHLLILHHLEILMLGGYLLGGEGFDDANQTILLDMDYITRGGRLLFILGGGKDEWSKAMWGEKTFLDHMQAEIVEVTNSGFTCRGNANSYGGSMIDYFIISKALLCLMFSVFGLLRF